MESSFAPPSGPPPPKVPAGWKAQWNDQYSEWFYVNLQTGKSQWDKPTEAIYSTNAPPEGAPPSYADGPEKHVGPEKAGHLSSNNPYNAGGPSPVQDISEDERLARQLQAEEDARAGGPSRGASDTYYGQPGQPAGSAQTGPASFDDQQLPPREEKRGFMSKLLGKSSSRPSQQQYGGQPAGYGAPYGGQPGYAQPGYGQAPYGGGGYGGGYGGGGGYYPPPQQAYGPPRRHGGGIGTGGAAALGLGGGLLGGVLLGEAIDGGDGGGDYGGDDGGGGDGGGDGGGGD